MSGGEPSMAALRRPPLPRYRLMGLAVVDVQGPAAKILGESRPKVACTTSTRYSVTDNEAQTVYRRWVDQCDKLCVAKGDAGKAETGLAPNLSENTYEVGEQH